MTTRRRDYPRCPDGRGWCTWPCCDEQCAMSNLGAPIDIKRATTRMVLPELDSFTYRAQMERLMHVVHWYPRKTACGWSGLAYGYWDSDSGWATLARDARVHAAARAAGGRAQGREPCERCLELMPAEHRFIAA